MVEKYFSFWSSRPNTKMIDVHKEHLDPTMTGFTFDVFVLFVDISASLNLIR